MKNYTGSSIFSLYVNTNEFYLYFGGFENHIKSPIFVECCE